ncbi:MAG: efflux transporter outer membrane subunit [Hyphomicrobiales bacterium]|nr:efflux transporter outer membrane subunit [Hyphomicrobiales bacterium]
MTSRFRIRIPALGGLALATLLAGCAVGPDFTPTDVAVPSHWRGAGAPKATAAGMLGEWWRDLRDPILDRLIADAVEGNLDVKTAAAKLREARALHREAIGGLLPSLDGSGSGTRQQTTSNSTGKTSVGSLFQTGLDASWEIDLFGGNARTADAAGAGAAAVRADLDATLLTLVGDVATNYAQLRGYQARIALARRTAKSQRETAALTRTKFETGSASAVDAAKAEATAASTEADIPTLETSAAEAIHRLSVLTGREPGALDQSLRSGGAIPAPRRALPAGVPADVLSNRPDVRAAEIRVAQYTAKLAASEAALYPSMSLTGAISTSAVRPGDLFKGTTIAWSWGPSVTIPIFEGGRLTAARDAAAATRDEYLIAFRASVLTALEDVENALVATRQEKMRAAKLATAVAAYRRAADLSRSLYSTGTSSFLDVLDAERSLYTAEASLIQSRVLLVTDHVALAKALGGGWTRPIETERPEVVDAVTGPRPAFLSSIGR